LRDHLAKLSPGARYNDLSPLVYQQRLIKSAAEIQVMRRAARVSSLACTEAMKATKAGVSEFQLGALADYFFQINGAQGAGYTPIIATGENIWMIHYWRNNAALRDGELVLFDYAPDVNNYTSDIGRMWPVSAEFTAVQRELCGFALVHRKVLLSLIRPGRTKAQILEQAAAKLRPVVEQTRWSKPIYRDGAMELLASSRPLSHGVGMSVHEATRWDDRPIEPGLVFAVDPELVIRREKLYIRVEDTIVVTETGIENLTASCPTELDEIEAIVGLGGILQQFPPVMVNPGR
jgi:Xaa-Pro aminopeptidase